MRRSFAISLLVTSWFSPILITGVSTPRDVGAAATATPPKLSTATFAMGCFWCGETAFEGRPGVISVVSGYTGGSERNPTYEQVSNHMTSHLEAIRVTFDPARMAYDALLDIFWHSVDPTQGNGQFCDHGDQYRSAVFYHDEAQRLAVAKSKRAIEASGVLRKPIVTLVRPVVTFWPAEEYHQDFWNKNPVRYTTYRLGCGRDRRLAEIWGKAAAKPSAH